VTVVPPVTGPEEGKMEVTVGAADADAVEWVNALPTESTAAQKLTLGHDTEERLLLPSMFAGDDHVPWALAAAASTNTKARLSRATLASTCARLRIEPDIVLVSSHRGVGNSSGGGGETRSMSGRYQNVFGGLTRKCATR
jgi:hypothetical protein